MIIKGLNEINEFLNEQEESRQAADFEDWKKGLEEWDAAFGVKGFEHMVESGWTDEYGEPSWVVVHMDANNKFVAVMGADTTPYKAWRDVWYYCDENGIDYAALQKSHNEYMAVRKSVAE